jgi:hypothetical protein
LPALISSYQCPLSNRDIIFGGDLVSGILFSFNSEGAIIPAAPIAKLFSKKFLRSIISAFKN